MLLFFLQPGLLPHSGAEDPEAEEGQVLLLVGPGGLVGPVPGTGDGGSGGGTGVFPLAIMHIQSWWASQLRSFQEDREPLPLVTISTQSSLPSWLLGSPGAQLVWDRGVPSLQVYPAEVEQQCVCVCVWNVLGPPASPAPLPTSLGGTALQADPLAAAFAVLGQEVLLFLAVDADQIGPPGRAVLIGCPPALLLGPVNVVEELEPKRGR